MYLALFLAPWVSMYAISTLAMNHRSHLVALYETPRSSWIPEQTIEFQRVFPPDTNRATAGKEILIALDMDGRHAVRGDLANGELTLIRQEAFAPRRIRYSAAEGTVTIERRESRMYEWLNALHSRRGYNQDYANEKAWALSVDLVIGAILFWAVSGVWLWLGIPKSRWLGGICVISGVALFAAFLIGG